MIIVDELMKSIDWRTYFNHGSESMPSGILLQNNHLLSYLAILSDVKDLHYSCSISDLLQYKHCPSEMVPEVNKELGCLFEHTRTYDPRKNNELFNAVYTYYEMSGKVERLLEKISVLNIDRYLNPDLDSVLRNFIIQGNDEFTLTLHYNEPSGYLEFEIPIRMLADVRRCRFFVSKIIRIITY